MHPLSPLLKGTYFKRIFLCTQLVWAFQMALVVKNSPANAGDTGNAASIPGSGRSPGGRAWQTTSIFSLGESHGQRSLAGYSPQGLKESDTTETAQHAGTVVECGLCVIALDLIYVKVWLVSLYFHRFYFLLFL